MGILQGNQSMVTDGLVLALDAASRLSFDSNLPSGTVTGVQTSYTTEGTYEFIVPEGVTQISAVCIGGGGAGGAFSVAEEGGGGGGGGGLSYGTITVTPDEDLDVVVGEGGECPDSTSDGTAGGDTYIARTGQAVLLMGEGGDGGEAGTLSGEGGEGGASSGSARIGGGAGGDGGSGGSTAGGGGGAAGYSGNGGYGSNGTGGDGAGGGGGGGGGPGSEFTRGAGGGVGLLGEHDPVENGEGAPAGENCKGGGGSGGTGGVGYGANKYGGGGAGSKMISGSGGEDGAIGGVRIVYSTANLSTQVYPLKSNVQTDHPVNTGNTKWKYMGYGGLDSFATLKSGVTWSNGEFDFNGTTSYVELSGTSSLNYPITTSVTLSLFVKFDSVGALKGLITKNRSTSTQLGLWLNASSKLIFSANGSDLEGSTTLTTGTWYNLVGVQYYNNRKIYVNGVLDGTKTSSFGTTPSGSENWMLGQATGVTEFLDGKITNASIYNRALTATEVLQNYNTHKGRFGL